MSATATSCIHGRNSAVCPECRKDYGRASEVLPSSEDPHVVVTEWPGERPGWKIKWWRIELFRGRAHASVCAWRGNNGRRQMVARASMCDTPSDAVVSCLLKLEARLNEHCGEYPPIPDAEIDDLARRILVESGLAATREADAEPNATTTRDPKPNPPDTATELLRALVGRIDAEDQTSKHATGEPLAAVDMDVIYVELAAARDCLATTPPSEGGQA